MRHVRPLRENIALSGPHGHHHHGGGGRGWGGGPGWWGGGGDTIIVDQTPSLCPVLSKSGKVVNYVPCAPGQGPVQLSGILDPIPDWALIGGAALAAWFLFRR